MDEVVLIRTGLAPLKFTGTLIADRTQVVDQLGKNRTFQVRLWDTSSLAVVSAVSFHSSWDREVEQTYAFASKDAREVAKWLSEFDPMQCVIPWPSHRKYYDRNDRLKDDIVKAYQRLVSDVLSVDDRFIECL